MTMIACSINLPASAGGHKALGPGLPESAYAACLYYELVKSGLIVEKEKPKKKFTATMYSEATKKARHLYYEVGWEINDIKKPSCRKVWN